jgi:hypothetical protein
MGYGDETRVGIAPEHFHEILTYARHIFFTIRAVFWFDKV